MNRYLLDTHVFLWWLDQSHPLSPEAERTILDSNNIIYVSLVSAWEIWFKKSLGKLQCPDDLNSCLLEFDFQWLEIKLSHIEKVGNLPLHHRDPFDRLLISQCQIEGLCLITRDEWMYSYHEVKQIKA